MRERERKEERCNRKWERREMGFICRYISTLSLSYFIYVNIEIYVCIYLKLLFLSILSYCSSFHFISLYIFLSSILSHCLLVMPSSFLFLPFPSECVCECLALIPSLALFHSRSPPFFFFFNFEGRSLKISDQLVQGPSSSHPRGHHP